MNAVGKITYVNSKAEGLLALSKNKIIDQPFNSSLWKFTDFEGKILVDAELPFSKVMQTNKPIDNIQHVAHLSNGSTIYTSINAYPLRDNKGKATGVIATAEDITELVRAKEMLKATEGNYKDLFDNLVDEVHLWKLIRNESNEIVNWELIDANPAALKSWRVKRTKVVGKTAIEIFNYNAVDQFLPIVKKIFKTKKPYAWEEYFEPTGQYLSMTSIPFNDFFISTGRDVTEKKKAEQSLIEAKEKAEEANQLKTEFLQQLEKVATKERDRISEALHDGIIQQMVVVSMKIDHLQKIHKTQDTEEAIEELRGFVKSITNQVREISHQLQTSDLLNYNLHQLFKRLEKQVAMYNEIQFSFIIELEDKQDYIPEFTKANLYRITQELITNIIKHSNARNAYVSLEVINEDIYLNVSDDGIGNIGDKISEGIGLKNITKRVHAMQGSITHQSKKGWHVSIVVPLSDELIKALE